MRALAPLALLGLLLGCAPANPVEPGKNAAAITPPAPEEAVDTTPTVNWPKWQELPPDMQVAIKQDGQLLPIHHGTVSLNAAPFKIVVRMPVDKDIWLNAQAKPTFANALRSGQRVYDLIPFAATGMAEGVLNDSRHITLASDRYHLWYYRDNENHRFDPDSIEITDGMVQAERTVEVYRDVDANGPGGPSTDIRNLPTRELFLVFFRTSEDAPKETDLFKGGKEELGRAYMELKFK